jgi:hypothetical protein
MERTTVATLLGFCPQLYIWSLALSPCTAEFENVTHSMYPIELKSCRTGSDFLLYLSTSRHGIGPDAEVSIMVKPVLAYAKHEGPWRRSRWPRS